MALELLTEPSLLILDEPTSGLDPALDRRVMAMLRRLADAGRVVIVVTHSLTHLHICDQVLLVGPGGRPAYLGAPELVAGQMGTSDWADIYTSIGADSERPASKAKRCTYGRPHAPRLRRDVDIAPAKQFFTVFERQFFVILADRQYLVFLLLMPIILGLLAATVVGQAGLATPGPDAKWPNEAPQLLSLLIVGTVFMGMSLSLRDLLSERAVFCREQAVGLSRSYYLLAKIVIFSIAAALQVIVLLAIVLAVKPGPDRGAIALGEVRFELYFALLLTSIVGVTLGLAFSAAASTHERLLPMLVVTIMAQIVFSGGLIPVTGRVGLEQLSWICPARWGFAATASTVDLTAIAPLAATGERLWTHSLPWWGLDIAVLTAQGALLSLVARWKLRLRFLL